MQQVYSLLGAGGHGHNGLVWGMLVHQGQQATRWIAEVQKQAVICCNPCGNPPHALCCVLHAVQRSSGSKATAMRQALGGSTALLISTAA